MKAAAGACSAGLPAASSRSPEAVDAKSSRISVSPASSGAGSKSSCGPCALGLTGSASGSTPSRSAVAAATMGALWKPVALRATSALTQPSSSSSTFSENVRSSGSASMTASARRALYNCSQAQAASPKSFRPTMRELPLRVWNARRTVEMDSKCCGSSASFSRLSRALAMTSSASSKKTSSISSSSAVAVADTAGAAAIGAGGVGAAKSDIAWAISWRTSLAPLSSLRDSALLAALAASAMPFSSEATACCASSSSLWMISAFEAPSSPAAAASDCTCSSSSLSRAAGASGSAVAVSSVRPITVSRRPVSASNLNSDLASCGCTPSRSMRKPSAPTLAARRPTAWSDSARCAASTSTPSRDCASTVSTSSRMRTTAWPAWSRPSTDSTPRMADSLAGTGTSSSRSAGLRLNLSRWPSTSASEERSSWTTLPMVWRSEARR